MTHVPHLYSIPIWRKLYLLSHRGNGLELAQKTRDDLAQVNIPGDHWLVLFLFKNWYEHDIPIPVGMCLWLLRERQSEKGSFARWPHSIVAEVGPAVRYLELAALVGEDCESDQFLRRAVDWLLSIRLSNGGMPTHEETGQYDSGITGQTLQALTLVDACGMIQEMDVTIKMLFETVVHLDEKYAAWGLESVDGKSNPSTGKTGLVVTAALMRGIKSEVLEKAMNWLLSKQRNEGSWSEYDDGKPGINATFYVFQALHLANEKGVINTAAYLLCKEKLLRWLNKLRPDYVQTLEVAERAFLLRLFTRVLGPQDARTINHLARLRLNCIEGLSPDVDIYGRTAILGIAIMEWVIGLKTARRVESLGQLRMSPELQKVRWLWNLEPNMPTFLRRQINLTDLLYTTMLSRFWLRIVDTLAALNLLEMLVGVVLVL